MRYTIQFSILMFCAKYQEAGLCGSREKCDRNYLSHQTGIEHAANSKMRYTIQFSILACVVPEKNVTEIFCDADADDARRRRKTTDSDP